MKTATTFTVKRSEWLRGTADGTLYCPTPPAIPGRQRCCLGFYGLACGFTDDEMLGHGTFAGLANLAPAWLLDPDGKISSDLAGEIMGVNDNAEINDDEREQELIELFAEAGVMVTFVD